MNYIFIMNDLIFSEYCIPAEELIKYLLENKHWVYTSNTPKIRLFRQGDKVLVYLAGPKRRYFYASFTIDGAVEDNNVTTLEQKYRDLHRVFKLSTKITNVNVFNEKVYLDNDLRQELSFIIDKKNWGLFFRQAVKSINVKDYDLICSNIRKKISI